MITDRTKTFAFIAASFFVVSAVVLGGMFYEMQRMTTTFKEQISLVQKNNVRQQEYSALARKVEETVVEREQLNQYIFTEADTISFLTEIEQLARNRGITLSTQSLDVRDVDASVYSELFISFSIEGTLTELQELVSVLEALPYHGAVTRMSFSGEGSEYTGIVSVVLSIATYD